MKSHQLLRAMLFHLAIAGAAAAQTTYVETFDDGMNHTNWTWDRTSLGTIEDAGGNPGGYFRSVLTPVPSLFCDDPLFTGNFRERRVGSIGADIRTVEFSARADVISLALGHFNGTPDNPFDDTYAHFVTDIPAPVTPDAGWVTFDVMIPFDAADTPAGWVLTGILPGLPATVDWATLIEDVDEVVIAWNNTLRPVLLFDVVRGADDMRVTYNVPAPAAAALISLPLLALRMRRRP